jgi:hypothetical protein
MSYITPISTIQTDNGSGLLQLRIARAKDVETYPRIIGGKLVGDVVFRPGTGFVPWEVIFSTSSFSHSGLDSMEGVSKEQRLPFTLASAKTQELLLDRMERDQFILYYLDGNLKPVIFGTPDRPVLFRYSHSTGNIRSGRNEYVCEFYSRAKENRAVYEGNIPVFTPLLIIRSGDINGEIIAQLGEGDTINLDADFAFTEIMLPIMPVNSGKFAIVNGTPIELGKTIIIQSDFTEEFDIA